MPEAKPEPRFVAELPPLYAAASPCSVEGCGKDSIAKGYCQMHYARSLRRVCADELAVLRRAVSRESPHDTRWIRKLRGGLIRISHPRSFAPYNLRIPVTVERSGEPPRPGPALESPPAADLHGQRQSRG